jgi:methionyl-tRNA synthetase
VHGYLLIGGQKLGKSMIAAGATAAAAAGEAAASGEVAATGEAAPVLTITEVSPLALADDFGVDPLRYHLLRDVALGGDGDFSYEGIVARYNADLANNLGNLLSRVATVVHSKCAGIGPASDPESTLAVRAAEVLAETTAAWARWAPHEALEATWRLIGATNAELESTEPWKMDPGPEVDSVLGNALEVLRIVAVLISPAMPAAAAEIWRRIGLEGDPSSARVPDDAAWGRYPGGVRVVKGDPLFPRRKG